MSWKKLMGAFVEMEDETTPAVRNELPIPGLSPVLTMPATVNTTVANGKIKEALASELKTRLAGTPYLTFQTIATGMKASIADVTTRTIATCASLTAQGTPKQAVLDSASQAIAFLQGEAASFESDITSNLVTLQQSYDGKSLAIAAALQEKQEAIKKLSEEIGALQKEKITLDQTYAQDKTNIELNKIEFNAALGSLVQEINSDVSDITRFGV